MKATIVGTAGGLAALLAAALALPAGAAMYRCGNVFQDRPCDDAASQQTIRPGKGAGSPAPAAPAPVPAKLREAPAAPAAAAQPAAPPVAMPPAAAASALRAGAPPVCAGLQEQAVALDGRLRAATNANTVEMLNRQRRAVERSWSEGGC